jgi:hypothetical protein
MCSYLYEWEGTYINYRYLCCHHIQKVHMLRKRGHLLFLRGRVGLGSFSPVLEAFLAGQPEMWLLAPSVSLPILLPITRFRFPKGIDPGLLNWAIRTRISLHFRPLLVTPTFLLLKVATLLSSCCPCCMCAAFRAVSSLMANLMTVMALSHFNEATVHLSYLL